MDNTSLVESTHTQYSVWHGGVRYTEDIPAQYTIKCVKQCKRNIRTTSLLRVSTALSYTMNCNQPYATLTLRYSHRILKKERIHDHNYGSLYQTRLLIRRFNVNRIIKRIQYSGSPHIQWNLLISTENDTVTGSRRPLTTGVI